ncbi:MAG: nitroreductase family protein [Erysipelotrichales bacterium]|nr:nitroreductase family protein [Erysipelotrichales bacterium]
MEMINKRRSVRSFKTEKLKQDEILLILKAGMQAPSARNQQPWYFMVVEDLKLIKELKEVSPGAKAIENAPCVIALLMKDDQEMTAASLVQQDMGACMQNMLLEATSLNIGSVWIGIYPLEARSQAVAKIIEAEKRVFALVAFGYPSDPEVFKFVDRFDSERISWK